MAELPQYSERNPWGEKNPLATDPRFKYENGQWWDLRGSKPVVDRALTEQYAGGHYDPGTTGSPWWWYSKMNPGLADTYRQKYGNSAQAPAGDVAPHPGGAMLKAGIKDPVQGMRSWVNPKNTGVGIGNFLPGFDPAKYGNQGEYSKFIESAGYDPVTGYKRGVGPNPPTGSAGSQTPGGSQYSSGSGSGSLLKEGLRTYNAGSANPAATNRGNSPEASQAILKGSSVAGNQKKGAGLSNYLKQIQALYRR